MHLDFLLSKTKKGLFDILILVRIANHGDKTLCPLEEGNYLHDDDSKKKRIKRYK